MRNEHVRWDALNLHKGHWNSAALASPLWRLRMCRDKFEQWDVLNLHKGHWNSAAISNAGNKLGRWESDEFSQGSFDFSVWSVTSSNKFSLTLSDCNEFRAWSVTSCNEFSLGSFDCKFTVRSVTSLLTRHGDPSSS